MKIINLRLPDTLGCTIVSTALLQDLREALPTYIIKVYTGFPDLLLGLSEVDEIIDITKRTELKNYDLSFRDYLEDNKPQENLPHRHLYQHMVEIANRQLSTFLLKPLVISHNPKVNLTAAELEGAKKIVTRLSNGKPLIWLQTKSSTIKKDWAIDSWNNLIGRLLPYFTLVDLSNSSYSRRQSIAITKFCQAGITLDTFLLHGSEAVKALNVIALLFTSYPEVVTYPDQTILNNRKIEITPELVEQTVLSLIKKDK